MAKEKQIFFAGNVDLSQQNGWDSVRDADPGIRSVKKKVTVGARKQSGGRTAVVPTSILEVKTADETRFSTGLEELNRVLGGGIVNGSLVLVGEIPVSVSRQSCFRCAEIYQRTVIRSSMFQARNLCHRSRCARNELVHFRRICYFCA